MDIVGCATPVTKWSVMVKEPAQMPWVFREAFRIAQDGRPGAVLIDLPVDVQRGMIEYDPTLTSSLPRTKPAPTPTAIDRALDMLKTAERPLLMLGGGVICANACEDPCSCGVSQHSRDHYFNGKRRISPKIIPFTRVWRVSRRRHATATRFSSNRT